MKPRTDLRYFKKEQEAKDFLDYLHANRVTAWKTVSSSKSSASFGKYCVHASESHRKEAEELRDKYNIYLQGTKYLRPEHYQMYEAIKCEVERSKESIFCGMY